MYIDYIQTWRIKKVIRENRKYFFVHLFLNNLKIFDFGTYINV